MYTINGVLTTQREQAVYAAPATDPSGKMKYVLGNKEAYICFDYCILDNGKILLHASGGPGVGHEMFKMSDTASTAVSDVMNIAIDAHETLFCLKRPLRPLQSA